MTGFLPPPWIKLDHSANIYPATMSKRLAAMFRLSIMLNEQIDPCILQQALIKTLHRFPSFNYRLKKGLFWHYFEWQTVEPTIQPDAVNPLISIVSRDEGNFLFRVRYFKSTIALEVFHALTDGNGGINKEKCYSILAPNC